MLKKIGLGVGALVVVLLIVIATRPSEFSISRAAEIAAPASVVFANVDNFQRWVAWSPWEKRDLEMKKSYEGPQNGAGAKYSWVGNSEVGEGRMEITESLPGEKVRIKLEFLKPFAATNDTLFTFEPAGAGTKVTWTMSGHNNFMSKAFSLVMDMDKMVGPDFEQGLASLKSVSEDEVKKLAEESAAALVAQAAATAPVEAVAATPKAE